MIKHTDKSRIPGFYRLDVTDRHVEIQSRFDLTDDELNTLANGASLGIERADKMVENCVGVFSLPMGLGLNFSINGTAYAVPMVVEEPSVVAAVSNMARLVHKNGGFNASADAALMIGQIQVLDIADMATAKAALEHSKSQIIELANTIHPRLVRRGGGARDIEIRTFEGECPMVVINIIVDCQEAMGANAINEIAEGLAPHVEKMTGGRVNLRILSNLADRRCARAACKVSFEDLATKEMSGQSVAQAMVEAYHFADVDPYRAATHNKGIMNGIDAVANATGNDWRSIEAGAHAFAARNGHYGSLTRWWIDGEYLHGEIELPMAVGVVGGSTQVHPAIQVAHKILGYPSAQELSMIIAAVGLAQNMGAIKALATDGIQRGHMTLHARSVALAAGSPNHLVDAIAQELVQSGQIKLGAAQEILTRYNTAA